MNQNKFRTCTEACRQCAEECELWAEKNSHGATVIKYPEFVTLNADCRQLCRTAAGFLERGSHFITEICTLLAQVCDAIIAACEQQPDLAFERSANVCRECANECRRALAIQSS